MAEKDNNHTRLTFEIDNPEVRKSTDWWYSKTTIANDLLSISYGSNDGSKVELHFSNKYSKLFSDIELTDNFHVDYIDDYSVDHNYVKRSYFTNGSINEDIFYQWHDDLNMMHVVIGY